MVTFPDQIWLPYWVRSQAWSFQGTLDDSVIATISSDIAAAVAIIVATLLAVEVWRRRRRRTSNVSLRELLIVVVLGALTFSWIRGHQAVSREESEFGLHVPRWPKGYNEWDEEFCAPEWVARFVGRDCPTFRHITKGKCSFRSATILPEAAKLSNLRKLHCDDKDLVPVSIAALATCPQLEELSLERIHLNHEMLDAIASIATLRKLTFKDCQHFRPDDLVALGRLKHIRELRCESALEIESSLIERLAVHRQLELLEVDYLFPTYDNLAPLSKLTSLRRLSIKNCIIDDDLEPLARLHDLESLSLMEAVIEGNGLKHLVTLRQLRTLELGACPIHDNAIDRIAQMPKLERLDLSESEITDAGLMRLREMRNLKFLAIDRTPTTDLARKACRDAIPTTDVRIHRP
jgi:hypothetical protein